MLNFPVKYRLLEKYAEKKIRNISYEKSAKDIP